MEFIETRAAVAWAPNQPLKIEELNLVMPQKVKSWFALQLQVSATQILSFSVYFITLQIIR